MSSKSEKLVEKRFLKELNSALINLNISVKPNAKIDFDKFSHFLADFIFHYSNPMQEHFLQERDDIHELW